jgi:CHAD domain-containing protein
MGRIKKSYHSDDIHAFRLNMKKCKVLIELMKYPGKDRSNRLLPASTNKIYKILGGIRNFRIQEKRIQQEMNHGGPVSLNIYCDLLKMKELNLKKDAKKLIRRQGIFNKKAERNISVCIIEQDPIQIDQFIDYYDREFDLLIFKKEKTDLDYHSMRKLLKSVQYVQPLIEERSTSPASYRLRKKSLKILTEKLGEYHDLSVTLAHLENELPFIGSDIREQKELMKIIQKWHAEKEEMRIRIMDQIVKYREFV